MSAFGAGTPTFDSKIVALKVRQARQPLPQRMAGHARAFAHDRRGPQDVFWLKENAEFLNILECTAQTPGAALDVYAPFYDSIEDRLGQYPQYYRFLLSICLDLEDLGMPGTKGEALCAWAQAQGLAEAELSDLQRAEAVRLLARRGASADDPALISRLHGFIDRTQTFAIPNKKAAYELTHIVFYLSEYGRRDPLISRAAQRSLTFAGLQAYLDQNYDLLAEICIAMRFAGLQPNNIWESAVMAALKFTQATAVEGVTGMDDYHAYFVTSWLAGLAGHEMMPLILPAGSVRLDMAAPPARPLRDMSEALDSARLGDWPSTRRRIVRRLSPDAVSLLNAAERSTNLFDEFYESFARSARPSARPIVRAGT